MITSPLHLTSDLCLRVEDESKVESCRNLFDQFLAYAVLQKLFRVDLDDPHKCGLHQENTLSKY